MNIGLRLKFVHSERVNLASHREYDEAWLERLILDNVQILTLGDLEVVSAQQRQSKGRLDLLLRDKKNETVFVVELMLGTLDETHIVRTIEYWLRESGRKSNEDYDCVAVLAAEDVLGNRFVDVVRFLSKQMPLVLLEIDAIKIEGYLTVQFKKVFDGRAAEPDEATQTTEATRESWVERTSAESISLVERFLSKILQPIDPNISLTFKQQFLGLRVGNRANNFVYFTPKRKFVRVHASTTRSGEFTERLKSSDFEIVGEPDDARLRFRLTSVGLDTHTGLLAELCKSAYEER